MEMLNNYLIPLVVAACLVVGFIIKKWIKDVDNKWIPTIVTIVGVALALVVNMGGLNTGEAVVGVIVGGAVSGLASTGLHQLFKQWIDNGGK